MNKKRLINVDIDLVNSLKAQGKTSEARRICEAFRENSVKQWKQDSKELAEKIRKILRTTHTCTVQYCGRDTQGYALCPHHRNINNISTRKYQKKSNKR